MMTHPTHDALTKALAEAQAEMERLRKEVEGGFPDWWCDHPFTKKLANERDAANARAAAAEAGRAAGGGAGTHRLPRWADRGEAARCVSPHRRTFARRPRRDGGRGMIIWLLIIASGFGSHASQSVATFPTKASCQAAGEAVQSFTVMVSASDWTCVSISVDVEER